MAGWLAGWLAPCDKGFSWTNIRSNAGNKTFRRVLSGWLASYQIPRQLGKRNYGCLASPVAVITLPSIDPGTIINWKLGSPITRQPGQRRRRRISNLQHSFLSSSYRRCHFAVRGHTISVLVPTCRLTASHISTTSVVLKEENPIKELSKGSF